MNGVIDKGRMEPMGHKTPSMTMRYTHLSVEYKRQAVSKLPCFRNIDVDSPQIPPLMEQPKVIAFAK